MALAPINTSSKGSPPTAPEASTTVLAKLFNQMIQKILNDAKENANS